MLLKNASPKKKSTVKQGFTLLEVVVAVVILGLAYVAILQNFSFSARNIARLQEHRTTNLENFLAFERQLHEEGEELQSPGEVFIKGQTYNLVIVTNEDGSLTSIQLEKL